MPRARALNFHGIGPPGRILDEGEAPYWLSRIAFEDLVSRLTQWPVDDEILLTFDDGNRSDIEIAAPVLSRRGMTGRIFVLTGRLGAPGSLDRTDIRALQESGFSIGSHGIDHVDWRAASPETLRNELRRSRSVLEDILGRPVTELAVPFGSYNARVLRAVRKAGYAAAWTSDGGPCNPAGFLRPRLSVRADMDWSTVRSALQGAEGLRRRLRRRVAMLKKRVL
jgi:peptidoglycan/xylan/chitin deacetylase (PgdA/CDA1 family)